MNPRTFEPCKENPSIMKFTSKNANLYMNETADECFIFSPKKAPAVNLTLRNYKGEIIKVEGVVYGFIEDLKND